MSDNHKELTNDESTWLNLEEATEEEQEFFDMAYVPALSQAFIFEIWGGRTEVKLKVGGYEAYADNVDSNGDVHEDKTHIVSNSSQTRRQLRCIARS